MWLLGPPSCPSAPVSADSTSPRMSREWAMPSPNTFSISPIARLLERVLPAGDSSVIIDPFARDSTIATLTNDLNPASSAMFHMEAVAFCDHLLDAYGEGFADAVLFDPPYSPRQISEVYQSIGKPCSTADTQSGKLYRLVRNGLDRCLRPGGVAVSFGWNSCGFGKKRGYRMDEILLVAHGGAHNDTIVVVERKPAPTATPSYPPKAPTPSAYSSTPTD